MAANSNPSRSLVSTQRQGRDLGDPWLHPDDKRSGDVLGHAQESWGYARLGRDLSTLSHLSNPKPLTTLATQLVPGAMAPP